MNHERDSHQLPVVKKLLFALVATIGALAMLEVIARIVTDPTKELSPFEEHEAILHGLGLPALNESMEADPYQFWRLKENLTDFRIHGLVSGDEIDFTVNTHNHLRSPPVPKEKKKPRILALGDSCTFGLGVDDQSTWPAQLQTMLAEMHDIEVINAGVPGYTAFQGRRFFQRFGSALNPDIVIATFSFNDQGHWGITGHHGASRSDAETARLLKLAQWTQSLERSRLYISLRNLIHTGQMSAPVRIGGQRPRLSISEFQGEIAEIHRLCAERCTPFILVIWPYRHPETKVIQPIDPYQQFMVSFCHEKSLPCANVLDAFVAADAELFIDHCHANENGCRIAAEVLRGIVKDLLD